MALNERDIGASKAASVYPGAPNLKGHRDDIKHAQRDAMHTRRASAGVVEGYPGIIESSHIEPLDEEYKEGEAGRGRTMGRSIPTQGQGLKERLATAAEGAANIVYGVATGDHQATNDRKGNSWFQPSQR
ncbi:hypothetical protein BKA82DRAFT_4114195 [Pisolithus tinctorius]|nr:hypothetical protein BKA82DRAFT_4114195 [Pisolithus tinctorius]